MIQFFRMQKSKGQVELEFLSLVSMVLIIFVLIYFLAFQKQLDVQEQRVNIFGKQLCSSLAFEIDQAYSIGTGYEKNVTLPYLLGDNLDYSIAVNLGEKSLLITWPNGACRAVIKADNVTGTFNVGSNTIRNVAGGVVIN